MTAWLNKKGYVDVSEWIKGREWIITYNNMVIKRMFDDDSKRTFDPTDAVACFLSDDSYHVISVGDKIEFELLKEEHSQ